MKIFAEIHPPRNRGIAPKKTFSSSNTTLVAKGNYPKTNKNRGRQYKKAPRPYRKIGPKSGAAEKQKAKGNDDKNIARVKCYNNETKDHFA